jgi:RNA polymerase sigma factor (TIGR02999 family)
MIKPVPKGFCVKAARPCQKIRAASVRSFTYYPGHGATMATDDSLTERLQLFMQGDSTVTDALLAEILPRLHSIAARELKRERYMAPLTKTELIHEVWIGSLGRGGWNVRDRGHFYALASMAMRRVLIDVARKRLAERRGGGETVLPLKEATERLGTPTADAARIVEIGILMERLEARDPDAARIVDMHYFTGFTLEEIAAETGLTFRQVRSRWERGQSWLKRMLGAGSTRAAGAG